MNILEKVNMLNKEVAALNVTRSKQEGALESAKTAYKKAVLEYEMLYGVKITAENLQSEYDMCYAKVQGSVLDIEESIAKIKSGEYKQEGIKFNLEPDVDPIRAEKESIDLDEVAVDTISEVAVDTVSEVVEEKQKRKRRTKKEIEAEKAAKLKAESMEDDTVDLGDEPLFDMSESVDVQDVLKDSLDLGEYEDTEDSFDLEDSFDSEDSFDLGVSEPSFDMDMKLPDTQENDFEDSFDDSFELDSETTVDDEDDFDMDGFEDFDKQKKEAPAKSEDLSGIDDIPFGVYEDDAFSVDIENSEEEDADFLAELSMSNVLGGSSTVAKSTSGPKPKAKKEEKTDFDWDDVPDLDMSDFDI